MHIEVCGSEGFNYTYRDKTYKKNGYHVIFVHVYKKPKEWQNYLVKRIMEIEKRRHDEVMRMLQTLEFKLQTIDPPIHENLNKRT